MSEDPTARRRFVFWTATALIGCEVILFTMVVPALPEFAERDGFSDSVGALIFAAFPVTQLIFAILAAKAVEHIGRRPPMIVAALTMVGASLMFALAENVAMLFVARGIQGAAAGVAWTAAIAAISDVYPSSELGFRITLAETAGGGLGLAGPIVSGALIAAVGLDTTFLLAAALPAALVGLVVAVPETRRRERPSTPSLLVAVRRLLRQPRARAGAAALATLGAVLAFIEPLLPLDLSARLDLSAVAVGAVFSAALLTYFIGGPIAGRWSDARGRRTPILVGGILLGIAVPLIGFGPVWWVAIWMLGVGAGLGVIGAGTGALLTEAVDEAGMPGAYGLSAGVLVVIFAAGYAMGPLAAAAGAAVAPFWALCIALGAVALLASLWGWSQLEPDDASGVG